MSDPSEDVDIPPQLRWLKRLVMVLTIVMIAGFCLLIGTLVVKLNADPVPLPDRLTLPAGAKATAYTQGEGWAAVVTESNEILIFDLPTGRLRKRLAME